MPLRRKLAWIALLYFAEGLPFGVIKEVRAGLLQGERGVAHRHRPGVAARAALDAEGHLVAAGRPLRRAAPVDHRLPDRAGVVHRDDSAVRSRRCRRWGCGRCCWRSPSRRPRRTSPSTRTRSVWSSRGEEGDANGVRVSAYRVALIASGGGLVLLAPMIGWTGGLRSPRRSCSRPRRRHLAARRASSCRWTERRHWLAPMRRWLLRPGRVGGLSLRAQLQARRRGDGADGQAVLDRSRPHASPRSASCRPRSALWPRSPAR